MFARIAQIQCPGGQQGIGGLLQFLDPCPQGPLPGPGGTVALHDRGQRIAHQDRVGQQFALRSENGGFGGAQPLTGARLQHFTPGANCQ